MLPEKLRLCRNDGFEAGPFVNRGYQCSTPRFLRSVTFFTYQKQPMTGFGTKLPIAAVRHHGRY